MCLATVFKLCPNNKETNSHFVTQPKNQALQPILEEIITCFKKIKCKG